MSTRLSKYQDSVTRFIHTRSTYAELFKLNPKYDELLKINDHEASIFMLTVFHSAYQKYKEKKSKPHVSYHMASGIDILLSYVMICDNIDYYIKTFGVELINDFITRVPIYVSECLS